MIPIIDDNIAEPCESFICTLQGGAQDAVRASEPNQVTIRISDDDCEHMHRFSSNVHIVSLWLQMYILVYVSLI